MRPTLCQTSLTPHTLSNFQSLTKLFNLRHILGCASSPTFLRHILGCASSPTFLRSTFAQPSLNLRSTFAQPSLNLRSTFAQPSLKVRPRWHKLAACAQFKIHNSKFIILPHSPLIFPLSSPYHPLIIPLSSPYLPLTIRLKISKKN